MCISAPQGVRAKPKRRRYEPEFYAELTKLKYQQYEMRLVIRDMVIYFVYLVIIFLVGSITNKMC
jgi:hypothetical protein